MKKTNQLKRLFICFLLAFAMPLFVACEVPPPEIHETSANLNTDDQEGPYQVFSTVESVNPVIKVELVYSTDGWKTVKKISMSPESRDVFKGKIPGQKRGTTIQYFIQVVDSENQFVITDPPNANNLLATKTINKSLMYRFQILSN